MIEIAAFNPAEIDEAIESMDGLRDILVPFLRKLNGDGMGEVDAQQCIRHLTIAKHALIVMGSYLESQMEGNNDPLTLEELREMSGDPVWVECLESPDLSSWAIRRYQFTDGYYSDFFDVEYGKEWLAYRRKPEVANGNSN